jgi:hypothetical protein
MLAKHRRDRMTIDSKDYRVQPGKKVDLTRKRRKSAASNF